MHQLLFQRGVRRALKLLPSLGPLRHVDFAACSAGAVGGDDAAQDRLVADILPHPLSLFSALLARPVATLEWRAVRPRPGEGGASLALRAVRCEPAYPGLRELVRAFYLAVEGGAPAPISGADAVDAAAARDRLGR